MSEIEIVTADLGVSVKAEGHTGRIAMASDIVAAYVTRNSLPASELPAFIASIYAGLGAIGQPPAPVEKPRKDPAVPIKKSITPDHIICLEDGEKFRTMRRHLRTIYNMTPEQYRAKWKLPADYPMTAPAYSAQRSTMAKASGLGAARKATATKKALKPRAKKTA